MEIDGKNELSHNSAGASMNTITYLKDQISYLHGKIFEKTEEIDRKNEIIRKIEAEKSEIEQKFEIADIKENEARRELESLREELARQKGDITVDDICKEFESKFDNVLLDSDGIKCFSFSQKDDNEDSDNILAEIENQPESDKETQNNSEKERQLKKLILKQEQTIVKLNKEIEMLTDNCHYMKNEIRCVSECEKAKTEELDNAEKEILKLQDEIKFFQESNRELVNSIDEVERTLQEIEGANIAAENHEGSHSESSQLKQSKRALVEENDKLKEE